MKDSYKTIILPTPEILYKERGSKFYATAFPLTDESQVAEYIQPLRKKYQKANHHCYAWKLGATADNYRSNDDGEPSHSAGDPILSQINTLEMSDILVVVTRIFGGTKLGVGGLIQAYREAARQTLDEAEVVLRVITGNVQIFFEYPQMSQVMRFIDERQYTIKSQELTTSCQIDIAVPLSQIDAVVEELNKMYPIKATS
ncbi:IMPACT family protein [Nonlabens marinus]|uniref:Protein co-occurring with transport systems n=1 Tax=Nonlabens marinus S1-08 TaxID=1454201 RepID=W8VVY8_9FLAO|nr:YigZ family protein [Nonlabens marinus]BAO55868.1 protein co-occurring with transport systems [Nonlabens marinus S1-08]